MSCGSLSCSPRHLSFDRTLIYAYAYPVGLSYPATCKTPSRPIGPTQYSSTVVKDIRRKNDRNDCQILRYDTIHAFHVYTVLPISHQRRFLLNIRWDQLGSGFLPERDYVTVRSGLCYRNSVCRLSVCNVGAPNTGVELFGKISSPLCTLAILWPPCKILRR